MLDKLTDKLGRHLWCVIGLIGLLMFWIVVFSVSGKGADIASWVSILFAIIVVTYMLIQGHEMRNLIEKGHRIIETRTGEWTQELNRALSLGAAGSTSQVGDEEQAAGTPQLPLNTATCLWLPLLVFYAVVKAYQSGRPIRSARIAKIFFEVRHEEDYVLTMTEEHLVVGIILGLSSFLQPGSIELMRREVNIKKLPPPFVSHLPTAIQNRIDDPNMSEPERERLQAFKDEIDRDFATM